MARIESLARAVWPLQTSPAYWSPYTSPGPCGDLSEKWVWVLSHPRSLDPRPAIVDVR
jgi:hypothetical protein